MALLAVGLCAGSGNKGRKPRDKDETQEATACSVYAAVVTVL